MALLAKEKHLTHLFIPAENVKEAAIVSNISIYPTNSLKSLFCHLNDTVSIEKISTSNYVFTDTSPQFEYDMKDIKGQLQAKRAMEIAAAGSHNMLLKGPPRAGKTMIAGTLASILPKLSFNEMIEVTKIYSNAGLLGTDSLIEKRPFRSPHHTISMVD